MTFNVKTDFIFENAGNTIILPLSKQEQFLALELRKKSCVMVGLRAFKEISKKPIKVLAFLSFFYCRHKEYMGLQFRYVKKIVSYKMFLVFNIFCSLM